MLVKTILKTLDIPKCESQTRRNKLPPLYGKEGLTDFPNKGELVFLFLTSYVKLV